MSNEVHSQWRSTDAKDDKPSAPQQQVVLNVQTPPPAPQVVHAATAHVMIDPSHVSLRIAAITGIGLVLAAFATFYFGVDFLRASLTNMATHEVKVTVEGTFWPSELTAYAGDEIKIINENADPQVIKSKEFPNLFERPAIFNGEESTLSIPSAAPVGTYTFYSETLSQDQIFTLTIVEKEEETSTEENSDEAIGDLLIPELTQFMQQNQVVAPAAPVASSSSSSSTPTLSTTPEITPAPAASSSSSSSSAAPVIPPQNNIPMNGVPPSLNLGNNQGSAIDPFKNSNAIPVNPYTVGNITNRPLPPKSETLHSGAPLRTHVPSAQPSTGTGMWLTIGLAFFTLAAGLRVLGKESI